MAMSVPAPERINHGAAWTTWLPRDGAMITDVGRALSTVTE